MALLTNAVRQEIATKFLEEILRKYPTLTLDEALEVTETIHVATLLLRSTKYKETFSVMHTKAFASLDKALEVGYAKIAAAIFDGRLK